MTNTTRTKDSALALLKQSLPAIKKGIDVESVKACLTGKLVEDVFESAWRHQFDENRSEFRGLVRDLVQESLEGAPERGSDDNHED